MLGSRWSGRLALAIAAVMVLGILSQAAFAAAYTWVGTGNTAGNPWTDPNQWDPIGTPNFLDTGAALGDDLTFGLSAVTTVNIRPTVTGAGNAEDRVNSFLFPAGAPAYTFVSANSDHDIDLFGPMTNSSGVLQTFASGIAFDGAACIVNGTTGDTTSHYAFECGDHIWLGGTPTYNGPFDVHVAGTGAAALQSCNVIINNAKIVVEGGMNVAGTYLVDGNGTIFLNGPWAPSSSATAVTKTGAGTLILNAASNVTARPWTIANGIVRARDSLAMGNATRIITVNGNTGGLGTLQLDNNITLNKNITTGGKQQGAATIAAIENVSGNNTVAGNVTVSGGGGQYNYSALSGKLTVNGSIVAASGTGGSRYLNMRGPGDAEFHGSVGSNNTASGSIPIMHRGTGTLTLSATDNWRLGHLMSIGGGTLKFASTFGNTEADQTNFPLFVALDDSTPQIPPRFHVEGASKLDFTDLTTTGGSNIGLPGGGLMLNRPVSGTGTIVGDVVTAAGAEIWPGEAVLYGNPPFQNEWAGFQPGRGTLTFQNSLDMSAGGVVFRYDLSNNSNGNNDKLFVQGSLSVGPGNTIAVTQTNGSLGSGSYRLLDYTGPALDTSNFTVTGVVLTPRQPSATLTSVDNQLNLDVVGDPATLTWVGNDTNPWDVGTTADWTGAPGPAFDNRFFDGDFVIFDDTGSNALPVSLVGTLSPGSATFTNTSAHPYTLAGDNLSVTNLVLNAGGTLTIANTGTFGVSSIALDNGVLDINRADPSFELTSTLTGAGTLRKDGANTLLLDGNSPAFTGQILVPSGTLKAVGDTALGAGGSLASGVIVADGATLDVLNGTTTSGTGTEAVAIAGTGVDGKGALTVSTAANSNGHINQITLNADAQIAAIGGGGPDSSTRSILWIDGPGAAFQGNGNNLSVLVDVGGDIRNSTEVDLLGVGDMNINNLTISGGGACYVGGNTTLGPTSGSVILPENGRFGLYGSLSTPNQLTSVIDKPINVLSSTAGGGIELWMGVFTLDSPITMNGNLDITTMPRTNSTTSTLTLTSPLTGSGSLTVHTNANTTTSRRGQVELVSDGNTWAGTTTIGGGGGMTGAPLNGDRAYLSVGNGGTTGSLPPGDVIDHWVLIFNKVGTYTVPNNISGAEGDVRFNAPGAVVSMTGVSTYGGVTQINAGTVKVNGLHTGGSTYTLAGGATLDLTTVITSPLTLSALTILDNATLSVRLATPTSTTDDTIVVNGTADLSAVTTITVNATSVAGPTLPDGNYLLISAGTLTHNGTPTLVFNGPAGQTAHLTISEPSVYLTIGNPPPPTLPPDVDNDGDVDFADYLILFGAPNFCFSGPAVPLTPGCEASDLDQDQDVDQDDFAVWQSCFTNSSFQAERPRCTHVLIGG